MSTMCIGLYRGVEESNVTRRELKQTKTNFGVQRALQGFETMCFKSCMCTSQLG
jgi:hypothetical protein